MRNIKASDGTDVLYKTTYEYDEVECGATEKADNDRCSLNYAAVILSNITFFIDIDEEYREYDSQTGEQEGWLIDVKIQGARLGGLVLSIDQLKQLFTSTVNVEFIKSPSEVIYEIQGDIAVTLEDEADSFGPPSERFAA